jgi:hypothetical protein
MLLFSTIDNLDEIQIRASRRVSTPQTQSVRAAFMAQAMMNGNVFA